MGEDSLDYINFLIKNFKISEIKGFKVWCVLYNVSLIYLLGTLTASNISDTAFWSSWDGDTTTAPSKNAVYDVLWDVETLLANL